MVWSAGPSSCYGVGPSYSDFCLEVSQIRGTFLGVPIIRITIFCIPYWVPAKRKSKHSGRKIRSKSAAIGLDGLEFRSLGKAERMKGHYLPWVSMASGATADLDISSSPLCQGAVPVQDVRGKG